jgi:serine phosphatase RsbU (regulator of sigma subunit)
LGLLEHSRFAATAIELQPGDGFLLYTDGLYGGSKTGRDRLTPERLRALLNGVEGDAQTLLRSVMDRVAPGAGDTLPDDLAAVAVRRGPVGPS